MLVAHARNNNFLKLSTRRFNISGNKMRSCINANNRVMRVQYHGQSLKIGTWTKLKQIKFKLRNSKNCLVFWLIRTKTK